MLGSLRGCCDEGQNRPVKPRPPSNPQHLDELMVMAVDFADFNLRSGRQTPPTLLAVTKKRPLSHAIQPFSRPFKESFRRRTAHSSRNPGFNMATVGTIGHRWPRYLRFCPRR
jgi:hypothetical protein